RGIEPRPIRASGGSIWAEKKQGNTRPDREALADRAARGQRPGMTELQIIGLTRFAYPGLGGFQSGHETVEARVAALWAPERLEARLRSLEHVTLRTLAAQEDADFRLLVVTGEALPQPWLGRLEKLVAALPQAELVRHPSMNQRHAMEETVNARLDPDGPPAMQFRMDDDDGVGRRFIARARELFGQVRPLWERHRRLCLDFNRGYGLALTPEGPLIEPQMRACLGVAQALFLDPSIRRTCVHFPHHKLPSLMPVLSMTDAPMWLRGIDAWNDSRPDAARLRPPTDEERRDLERRFGLELEKIRSSFPGSTRGS
ncbi:glycosyltransferase, partial [Jannaschia aquimarina]